MPTVTKRAPLTDEAAAREILGIAEPPVARFRLLSEGIKPYNRLNLLAEDITGDKGCVACGNCVDSCPVLRREPERLAETDSRTSMALETSVADACEKCYACVLACPQVETKYKDFIVDEVIREVIPQNRVLRLLDNYLMVVVALIIGIVIGIFMSI